MNIDFLELIQILPELLGYVVPGYIACYVYKHYRPDYTEAKLRIKLIDVNTVVVSFLVRVFVDAVMPVFSLSWRFFIYVIVAGISGVLLAVITKSRWFECIMNRFFGSSAADTIWDAMSDPHHGTAIDVTVGDKIYQGDLLSFYKENEVDWVAIQNFQVVSKDGSVTDTEPLTTTDGETLYPRIAIKLSDCSQFVTYLSKKSANNR